MTIAQIIFRLYFVFIGAYLCVVLTRLLRQRGRLLERMEETFRNMDKGFRRTDEGLNSSQDS